MRKEKEREGGKEGGREGDKEGREGRKKQLNLFAYFGYYLDPPSSDAWPAGDTQWGFHTVHPGNSHWCQVCP